MTTKPIQPRLPVKPLLDFVRLDYDLGPRHEADIVGTASAGNFAALLDVHPRIVHRWLKDGGLPERTAEKAAIHLGVDPHFIWPEWETLQTPSTGMRVLLKERATCRHRLAHFRARRDAAHAAGDYDLAEQLQVKTDICQQFLDDIVLEIETRR